MTELFKMPMDRFKHHIYSINYLSWIEEKGDSLPSGGVSLFFSYTHFKGRANYDIPLA